MLQAAAPHHYAQNRTARAAPTLETWRKSRMPLGEELSKVSRCVLFSTNSAMNLSTEVDTSGTSAHASSAAMIVGKCAGCSQSNSRPAWHAYNTITVFSTPYEETRIN